MIESHIKSSDYSEMVSLLLTTIKKPWKSICNFLNIIGKVYLKYPIRLSIITGILVIILVALFHILINDDNFFGLILKLQKDVLALFGVFATLVATILATLSTVQSKRLEKLTFEIADATRNPIEGIDQVLVHIEKMLRYQVSDSPFWYLGLTLGIGPLHEVDKLIEDWEKYRRNFFDDSISYSEMYNFINNKLKAKIKNSTKLHIVCLSNNSKIKKLFVDKLNKIEPYKSAPNIKKNLSQLRKFHKQLKKDAEVKKAYKDIDTLPIQVMITDIKNNKEEIKRAMVVFAVGTQNVGSRVLGFYSEAPSTCNLFADYVESLCN